MYIYIPLYKIWHNKSTIIIIVNIYEHSIFYIPTWVFFFFFCPDYCNLKNKINSFIFNEIYEFPSNKYTLRRLIKFRLINVNGIPSFSLSFKDLILELRYFFFIINIHIEVLNKEKSGFIVTRTRLTYSVRFVIMFQ